MPNAIMDVDQAISEVETWLDYAQKNLDADTLRAIEILLEIGRDYYTAASTDE